MDTSVVQDFVAWVNDPSAYNWITLIGVFGGLMTAAFTGYSAYTHWADRRSTIYAEWNHEFTNSEVQIWCEITNNTKGTITGERVSAYGLPSSIKILNAPDKHESWAPNEAGLRLEIPSKSTKTVKFVLSPDPKELRQSGGSYSSRIGSTISKLLWRQLQWKYATGGAVSIKLTVRRRISQVRPIRLTYRIRIYAATAISMADQAEAKIPKG
jgi:hypothetical protein